MSDPEDKPTLPLETKLAALAVATPIVHQIVESATALFSAHDSKDERT